MIRENVKRILDGLPEGVELIGVAKTRSLEEIREAVDAGIRNIGENYVQEAERAYQKIGQAVKWHMIGHLQSNKAKKAVRIFDMIETVDSVKLAEAIDRACGDIGKVMPVLIEINSGEESQKAGVMPEDAASLIREMTVFRNIRIMGLMTMGPFSGEPEDARPYFRRTREVFDEIRNTNLSGVEMKHLSMGMSNSYNVAIEEGANMVRIGTKIFGERIPI
jgi:pyridoxal phosphate enzyme (YggS family)